MWRRSALEVRPIPDPEISGSDSVVLEGETPPPQVDVTSFSKQQKSHLSPNEVRHGFHSTVIDASGPSIVRGALLAIGTG